jgi:hypothetical protein
MIPPNEWERRRVPRFDVAVSVKLVMPDCGRELTGTCKNVSAGGMLCYVGALLESGRELQFALRLPANTMLEQPSYLRGQGSVVRVYRGEGEQVGLGIIFERAEFEAERNF